MNRYEAKDCSDSELTSRPHGVEVKLRPCIHEIYLTIFVQTLILFCKFFGIEKRLIMPQCLKVVNGLNGHVMPYLMENVY